MNFLMFIVIAVGVSVAIAAVYLLVLWVTGREQRMLNQVRIDLMRERLADERSREAEVNRLIRVRMARYDRKEEAL